MPRRCGPASSTSMRDGEAGSAKYRTVATTSSRATTCNWPVSGMTGTSGRAARPRNMALAPKADRPMTTDGRRITQSRSRLRSASSPACLVCENALAWCRSTPIAEKWITRRTPAASHAAKRTSAPLWWALAVFSRGLSCSAPTQFTTASIPRRCGVQACAPALVEKSISTQLATAGPAKRAPLVTPTTVWPCAARRAQIAEPISPVAPVTRTLMRLRPGHLRQGFHLHFRPLGPSCAVRAAQWQVPTRLRLPA